ncbi:MAG: hypothetical protein M3347_13135 [Armatimonadota bacterium]|nr:hypothetical protein [Armatimonadota bacterium]
MKSRAKFGCLVAVLALCGLAAFLVWRARTPPQVTDSVPFSQLPPVEQQRRREDAKKFTHQVHEIVASARRKEHKPFTLVVTEQQLDTLLQDRVQTDKLAVRDLRVGLEPNQVALQGRIVHKGFEGVVTLSGNIVADNGKLAYRVESLKIGSLFAPSGLKRKIERGASEKLNRLLQNAPGRITSVTVERDNLTIEGVTD